MTLYKIFQGTEIDEEDYFATLEKNTCLMILENNQKWMAKSTNHSTRILFVDDTDHFNQYSELSLNKSIDFGNIHIETLVSSLHNEPAHLSELDGSDLELLSDMNPDSLADIVSDRYKYIFYYFIT